MITLDGNSLTIKKCEQIMNGVNVSIAESAIEKVNISHKAVERIVSEGKAVYGITTGFVFVL